MNKSDWLSIAVIIAAALAIVTWCKAQDRPVTAPFYFPLTTAVSGGTFTNADSAPTWTLLKNGNTVVTTGTFTVCGTGTLAGNYYGSLTLNAGSFTVGTDSYTIEATGTISSIPVKINVAWGRVLPAETAAGYVPVDLAKILGTTNAGTAGYIGIDWGAITRPATANNFSASQFGTVTLATTATNLTNAPTVGDFNAAMKTSLNAATPAVTVSDKTEFTLVQPFPANFGSLSIGTTGFVKTQGGQVHP